MVHWDEDEDVSAVVIWLPKSDFLVDPFDFIVVLLLLLLLLFSFRLFVFFIVAVFLVAVKAGKVI